MKEIPAAVAEYLNIVEAEEFPVCNEQKQLAQMIRHVLENEDVHFNIPQLEKYLSYEKYFPFKLFPWERFVFALHNTLYNADDTLRFPVMFACMGRGTGKTGYSSFENFCLLTETNGIRNYDIYTFAMSEKQAKMAWGDMWEILEENPTLFKRFFHWTKEEITNLRTNSTWYYCTSSYKSKDGQRPGKVDFDEYHAYEDYRLIDVAVTGLGKKKLPRRTITTTNGIVRGGPFDDLFNNCIEILAGEKPDNGTLPFICRIDDEKEVEDEKCWHKANPSLRYFSDLLVQMRSEYNDYKISPTVNINFLAKRMNRPPRQLENEVTSWENIKAATVDFDKEILRGRVCVGGIDYASTIDFVGAGLLFPIDGIYYWVTHTWICADSPFLSKIKAPISLWEMLGHVSIVHAPEISPELPAVWLANTAAELGASIIKIGIDNYRYTLLSKALRETIGFSSEKEYGNIKLVRASDEMKNIPAITAAFAGHRIKWGDVPIMSWYANNTKIELTSSGNMTYQKIEPKFRKTDGFKAFAAAFCACNCIEGASEVPDEMNKVYTY